MGIGGSKNKKNKPNKAKEAIQINKINESIKINTIKNKNNRIKECIIQPFEKIDRYLSNISRAICKIKIETILGIIIGKGFLELFHCLISNEHVIKKDIIYNNININIYYDNEFKNLNIKLGNSKRYIKTFIDIDLDITVVELLDEDNVTKEYFIFPELEDRIKNRLINNMIYIPQYAGGK